MVSVSFDSDLFRMCVGLWATVLVWESEDNCLQSLLSFERVGPRTELKSSAQGTT